MSCSTQSPAQPHQRLLQTGIPVQKSVYFLSIVTGGDKDFVLERDVRVVGWGPGGGCQINMTKLKFAKRTHFMQRHHFYILPQFAIHYNRVVTVSTIFIINSGKRRSRPPKCGGEPSTTNFGIVERWTAFCVTYHTWEGVALESKLAIRRLPPPTSFKSRHK